MPPVAATPPALAGGVAYPRMLDVTETGKARGTVWVYPDGGIEVVAAEYAGPPAASERQRRDTSVYSSAPLNADCPRASAVVVALDAVGHPVAEGIARDACPWLALGARLENELRAGRRARSQVRRLARSNSLRYMTTFTVPASGPRDRAAVAALWRGFLQTRAGRVFFRRGWLATLERHKAGGYHVHVLHPNRLPVVYVRECWTRFLVQHRGYTLPFGSVCVQVHAKAWGSARTAARYASKYVSKGFSAEDSQRGLGGHRFLRSQGLADCGVRQVWESLDALRETLSGSFFVLSSEDVPGVAPVAWLWAGYEPGGGRFGPQNVPPQA